MIPRISNDFIHSIIHKTPIVSIEAKRGILKWALQENKVCKISRKRNISYPLIHNCACAYQGVKNVRFLENLACFVFL